MQTYSTMLNIKFTKEPTITTKRPKAKATLQIENERTIITQWQFSLGAETGWHKYGYDSIVVPTIKGKLLLENPDGENMVKLEVGQSYYRSVGVEHNVVNINDFPFSFVEIEFK